jgi:Family of unknown function (DUF6283)
VSSYALRRPCPKCPFRTDVPGYLRRDRAAEIARAIAGGSEFACHQTTEYSDETDDMEATERSQFCAGALIVMEHEGAPNQIMRVAERFGAYDRSVLDMEAPVHRSLAAFVTHHGEADAEDEYECCSTCGPDCEAPAGYLVDGVVVPAEPGETFGCAECGESVCGACCDDAGRCEYCAEVEAAA